jgi:hypothetical protein
MVMVMDVIAVRERIRTNLAKRKNQELRDGDGFATAKLAKQIRVLPATVGLTLRRMQDDGEIERVIEGKRTYAIRLADQQPAPTPNGQGPSTVVNAKRQKQLEAVMTALEEHAGLVEENANLQKELGKAEEKIEAQSLQIAALTRQVESAKETTKLLAEIQERLRKIS